MIRLTYTQTNTTDYDDCLTIFEKFCVLLVLDQAHRDYDRPSQHEEHTEVKQGDSSIHTFISISVISRRILGWTYWFVHYILIYCSPSGLWNRIKVNSSKDYLSTAFALQPISLYFLIISILEDLYFLMFLSVLLSISTLILCSEPSVYRWCSHQNFLFLIELWKKVK